MRTKFLVAVTALIGASLWLPPPLDLYYLLLLPLLLVSPHMRAMLAKERCVRDNNRLLYVACMAVSMIVMTYVIWSSVFAGGKDFPIKNLAIPGMLALYFGLFIDSKKVDRAKSGTVFIYLMAVASIANRQALPLVFLPLGAHVLIELFTGITSTGNTK